LSVDSIIDELGLITTSIPIHPPATVVKATMDQHLPSSSTLAASSSGLTDNQHRSPVAEYAAFDHNRVARANTRDEAGSEDGPLPDGLAGEIVDRIEHMIGDIMDDLLANRPMVIPLRSRNTGSMVNVSFPGTTDAEAKRFSGFPRSFHTCMLCFMLLLTSSRSAPACLLLILYMCRDALVSGKIITKRFARCPTS
jgi:hypothetical protein